MSHVQSYDEFLNENVRFLNFKTALSSAGIQLQWMDELKDIPSEVQNKAKVFGSTLKKDIAIVFDKDTDGNFDKIKSIGGPIIIIGEDPKEGRFALINTRS
jgi:hypothetical protein